MSDNNIVNLVPKFAVKSNFKSLLEKMRIKDRAECNVLAGNPVTKALHVRLNEDINEHEYVSLMHFLKVISGVKDVSEVKTWVEV